MDESGMYSQTPPMEKRIKEEEKRVKEEIPDDEYLANAVPTTSYRIFVHVPAEFPYNGYSSSTFAQYEPKEVKLEPQGQAPSGAASGQSVIDLFPSVFYDPANDSFAKGRERRRAWNAAKRATYSEEEKAAHRAANAARAARKRANLSEEELAAERAAKRARAAARRANWSAEEAAAHRAASAARNASKRATWSAEEAAAHRAANAARIASRRANWTPEEAEARRAADRARRLAKKTRLVSSSKLKKTAVPDKTMAGAQESMEGEAKDNAEDTSTRLSLSPSAQTDGDKNILELSTGSESR